VALPANSLLDIAETHKPAKNPHYLRIYDRFFSCYDQEIKTILEIGVGDGECLRMWRDYFPEAFIFGLDICACRCFEEDRIRVLHGDQGNAQTLETLAMCGPFDLIIDDGSHRVRHQKDTFFALFPTLRPGGVYAIEDMHTSYWPGFGGGRMADNTVECMCALAHGLNYSYWKNTDEVTDLARTFRKHNHGETDYIDAEPSFFDLNVGSVHFYESLCLVTRVTRREA